MGSTKNILTKTKLRGFTFIELVVALAVAAIVVSVAMPQFASVLKSNNMSTNVNDLVHSLNITRSEAMKSNRASICTSTDNTSCNATSTWNQGWIVFTDLNGNCIVNTNENVVKATQALPNNFNIGNGGATTNCITYSGEGFLFPTGSTATFIFCDDRDPIANPNAGRIISVIRTGRPTTGVYTLCPTV